MLNQLNAIATVGVRDVNSARKFYEKTLGLEPIPGDMPEGVQLYKSGNSQIEIYNSEFAGTNKATALSWVVGENIKDEVENLKKKGVRFEHYDLPEAKLEGDIHIMGDTRAAWFKDPDGNILCIANH